MSSTREPDRYHRTLDDTTVALAADPVRGHCNLNLVFKYGMNTLSTGGTLIWAMACDENGLLPEGEKFRLCFGRPEGLLATIPAIAERTAARKRNTRLSKDDKAKNRFGPV